MKFFIDTADIGEIRLWNETGLVDGVTTNPTLIAQKSTETGVSMLKIIEEICSIVQGPVSAEVTAVDAKTMILEGEKLAKIAPNVAVKVPLTIEGLKACKHLSDQNIMVNVTLCFSATQALLAAKAGAAFISPFIGRLDDIGQEGDQLIQDILDIYSNYPALHTEILAASIRSPLHVLQVARIGADVATIPPKVLKQLYHHPLTDKGLDAFLKDWKQTGQSIL